MSCVLGWWRLVAAWRQKVAEEVVATEGGNEAWRRRVAIEACRNGGSRWNLATVGRNGNCHDGGLQRGLATKVAKEAVMTEGRDEAW